MQDPIAKVMNKDEFTAILKEKEVPEDAIETEWKRIEQAFVFNFFDAIYNQLDADVQKQIDEDLDLEKKEESATKLIAKINDHLTNNPESVDKEAAMKAAAERTEKMYNDFVGIK